MTAGGDDAARAMGGVATRVFDDLMPATAAKAVAKPATKTASKLSADTLGAAKKYLDKPAPATPKKTSSKKAAPVDDSPRKISVLKINDNTDMSSIPVNVKKYLPDLPDEVIPQQPAAAPAAKTPQRAALQLHAMEQSLPTPRQISSMSDEQLRDAMPTWRAALANIMAVAGFSNQEK